MKYGWIAAILLGLMLPASAMAGSPRHYDRGHRYHGGSHNHSSWGFSFGLSSNNFFGGVAYGYPGYGYAGYGGYAPAYYAPPPVVVYREPVYAPAPVVYPSAGYYYSSPVYVAPARRYGAPNYYYGR